MKRIFQFAATLQSLLLLCLFTRFKEINSFQCAQSFAPRLSPSSLLKTSETEGYGETGVDDVKMENAWRYVKKPLLRIGSRGLAESHGNSLKELLAQHDAVKVKVNTGKLGTLGEVFNQLKELAEKSGAPSGIELIRIRPSDNTIMFGSCGLSEKIVNGDYPPPPPPPPTEEELMVYAAKRKERQDAKRAAKEAKEAAYKRRVNSRKS